MLATITVNTVADADLRDDALSLREAILLTNGDLAPGALTPAEAASVAGLPGGADPDTIAFAIPGAGLRTIAPTSALPAIRHAVTLAGDTQPGSRANGQAFSDDAVVGIAIDGVAAGTTADGLSIAAPGVTVRGLAIGRFAQQGLTIARGASGVRVVGNFLGTHPAGEAGWGNGQNGLMVRGGSNTIGGPAPADRNVISGNGVLSSPGTGSNLRLSDDAATGNLVQGNFIGPDASGIASPNNPGNGVVVFAGASSNTIGGPGEGAGNVISGNRLDGVLLGSIRNRVEGNRIGTTPSGLVALGNAGNGITLFLTGETIVAGNVVAGNAGDGVAVKGLLTAFSGGPVVVFTPATRTTIVANRIGVGADDTTALANGGTGISLYIADDTTIGGIATPDRNLIANNAGAAIEQSRAHGTIIDGRPSDPGEVNLSVTLSSPPGPIRVGGALVVSVTVANAGFGDAHRTLIGLSFPPGMTFASTSLDAGSTPQILGDGSFQATLLRLAAGGSRSFTVTLLPVAAVTGAITATASPDPSTEQADPNPADNSASVAVTVSAPPVAVVGGVSRAPIKTRASALAIRFNGPLDAGRAANRSAYRLVTAGRDRRLGTRDDKAVRIAGVRYDAAANTVTIVTRKPLPRPGPSRLMLGTPAATLTDAAGFAIAGGMPSLDFNSAGRR